MGVGAGDSEGQGEEIGSGASKGMGEKKGNRVGVRV